MNEKESDHLEAKAKEQQKKDYISLAKELSEIHEGFPFPGIDPGSYSNLKSIEEEFPEYTGPGYPTVIDELVEKFQAQGMKVVLGDHPEGGEVFILPLNSGDIEKDSLFPRQLKTTEDMNDALKKLILINIGQKRA